MLQLRVRGWRPGRGTSLLLGMFGLAGLFLASAPRAALPKADAAPTKTTPSSRTPPKTPPAPFPHEIVAKTSDVAEMAKVINERLEALWKANKVTPSRYVDDYEFIRRASLDLIGRVAKLEEIKEYLADPPTKRRSMLIERLLGSEDYARHWANLWTNWLLTRAGPFGRGMYRDQMVVWLEDQFAQNKPYHQVVEKLLTASGRNTDNGAVNFILAHVGENLPPPDRAAGKGQFEMVPITSRITRLFLGTQIQCAQCHDHPFYGSLKQNHFWGVNAFLRQVEREGNPVMRRNMAPGPLGLKDNTSVLPDGIVSYEKRNGVVLPTRAEFLPPSENKDARGPRMDVSEGAKPRREQLARFVIEHDMFPKAIVNRMWGVFMGRGFVNPVDDFNDNNMPPNPELLNDLAARFKHYNYDLKKLIRWITHSKAYHLSAVANKTNDKPEQEILFSRMMLKSMSPEQLFESLMVATRSEAAETKKGKEQLKTQWLRALVANFGDDEGNEVNFNGTVVQALLMMNGKDINDAISRKDKGAVALAMKRNRYPAAVVTELYLSALNRKPTAMELRTILSKMPLRRHYWKWDAKNPAAKFEDLFWALLNSNEFLLNH